MRIYLMMIWIAVTMTAAGEQKFWTNSSGGSWNLASNWSPNGSPGVNDVVIITNVGSYQVTLDRSTTISGLILGGDSGTNRLLIPWGTTLELLGNGSVGGNGQLLLSGTLSGNHLVELAGSMSWNSGVIDTGSVLKLTTNGSLLIGGESEFNKSLLGCITNGGTLTYKPYGGLVISGTLHNLAGALFDVQSPNRSIYQAQSKGMIINEGVLRISSGDLTCEAPLINSGTLDNKSGKVVLGDRSVIKEGSRFTGTGATRLNTGTNTLVGTLFSENLVFSGAAITGTGVLCGLVTWGAGTIETGASVLVATNGQLVIGGGANYSRILRGSLTNAGTIVYEPPGPFGLAGPLHNLKGGLFEVRWDNNLFNSGPDGLFINDGIFRKSKGQTTTGCEVPFINSGTVEILSGKFVLEDGSIFKDGSQFIGTGVTRLDRGTNILSGSLFSENLLLYGATISGTGILSGTVTWGAGAIETGASVLVATNGQLMIGGGANYSRILRGSLTNAGTIVYEPPGPFGLAGPLHNLNGSLFEVRWDNNLFSSGPGGQFINDGVFCKSSGQAIAGCEVPFLNRATVEIRSGRMNFSGPFDQQSGEVLLRGGAFRSDQPFILAGGRLMGWGTVAADVVNAGGTISPDFTNGILTINGTYTQRLGGSLEVILGGINPGTNLSHLKVSGAIHLNGTLDVRLLESYLPAPGYAFPVLSYTSIEGRFARLNGLILLGHHRQLIPTYGPKLFSLVTVEQPDPERFSLQIGMEGNDALISWPIEFGSGSLYYCTNLSQPTWIRIPTPDNQFLDQPMSGQKFFKLLIP